MDEEEVCKKMNVLLNVLVRVLLVIAAVIMTACTLAAGFVQTISELATKAPQF